MIPLNELSRAVQLRETGRWEEARALLLELSIKMPEDPSVWYQCAWVHDVMELEREAVPFYEKALELGISGGERQGALLGLGSTFRTLGWYERSKAVLEQAIAEFPERREFQVFYAMVLYNLKEHGRAMEILLKQLAETSRDTDIQSYKKAILFYSDKLERVWE
ncbi:tetratricopeptide repeat protein [Cohnella lupini]|uniref:Tetratricopeptide repeat protein n=1 Tax=Cohnella lupini TaxID=1294267 RepID=A0A3D9IBM2_9BACL|nr:tetratricopeptide repeat protein [Cohnella lupini]